jgi:hypothetical protein
MASEYILGQIVLLSDLITNPVSGATLSDATDAVTVYRPDGTTITPAVTHPGQDNAAAYDAQITVDQSGWWEYVWRSTTTGAGAGRSRFWVSPVP